MEAVNWNEIAELRARPDAADLVKAAMEVRERAWAPYSGFLVGAALRDTNGRVHLGANVENASYGAAICAERSAVVSAVSAGVHHFVAIAIATDSDEPASPCGICRQTLAEFALTDGGDLELVLASTRGKVKITSLRALLPDAFTPTSFAVRPRSRR